MLCTNCKKREAIVFITSVTGNEKKNEGLCLVCAKERNLPQINEYIKQMGISDDDIEEFADAMTDMRDNFDLNGLFKPGGTNSALPNFFNSLFGNNGSSDAADTAEEGPAAEPADGSERTAKRTQNHKRSAKDRKYLSNFCTNITEKAKNGTLDKIVGRDTEISRAIGILCRRQKN
ncbi:MAG: ATP-dependent Clp protease ATP-binding subunit, partial [Oscillospiraceae bacterium]|nr:ATP-dependent Clp protease ATP-binding subunit [Oscillospiraceae bacterium]